MAFKTLLQICLLFWSLSKPGQDALLWSLQSNALEGLGEEESEDDSGSASSSKSDLQRHVQWYIGETRVCRRAFQRFMGIGCGRLKRTRDTFKGLDERTLPGRACSVLVDSHH